MNSRTVTLRVNPSQLFDALTAENRIHAGRIGDDLASILLAEPTPQETVRLMMAGIEILQEP